MTMDARPLAEGLGWHVQDMICSAGPHDRAYEEQHATVAIAAVMSGTFLYRTAPGSALLVPGAILLGDHGRCFECGHEHGTGDRCLSFHFTPAYWEDVVAAMPGLRKTEFGAASVPPAAMLIPVMAALEAAREAGQPALEEVALDLAGAVLRLVGGLGVTPNNATTRDERRISEAVRWIEETAHDLEEDRLSVGRLAREAGMSPYHFLRTFRSHVAMTPHQYVLHTRMIRAATRLRLSDAPISTVAFEAGFNDLSTFNRRFRKVMGASPGAYRRQANY